MEPERFHSLRPQLDEIRRELEYGCGTRIVSGGQTGIDQIALRAAASLGLANHAVLPAGNLTETGPLSIAQWTAAGRPRLHTLSQAGYPERTWASAGLADATLLLRFRESSGTRATAQACARLGRTLIPIAIPLPPARKVVDQLIAADTAILNVAGHRGSLLQAAEAEMAERFLRAVFSGWAAARAQRMPLGLALIEALGSRARRSGRRNRKPHRRRHLMIAVPASGLIGAWIERQIENAFGITGLAAQRPILAVEDAAVALVRGRARDFGQWLRHGAIDAAVAGADDLLEGGAELHPVYDTGLFASSIVLLTSKDGFDRRTIRPVSQMPRLAAHLLKQAGYKVPDLKIIEGGAESWAALGLTECCVDTWSTGRQARQSGLRPLAVLGHTSLCLAAHPGLPDSDCRRLEAFAASLCAGVNCTAQ